MTFERNDKMIHVLYLKLSAALPKMSGIKERRAVAQRLRDQLKNGFNCSAKIDYHENGNSFTIFVCSLGESEDYLERLAENMQEKAEVLVAEAIGCEYDIEPWPF